MADTAGKIPELGKIKQKLKADEEKKPKVNLREV